MTGQPDTPDSDHATTGPLTTEHLATSARITQRCGTPAPCVVNGQTYVGCDQPDGHDGLHQVTVRWSTP